MNIVAVAAEPEYLVLNLEKTPGGHAGTLTINIAHLTVTEKHNAESGSVQIGLMASDIKNIVQTLILNGIVDLREDDEAKDYWVMGRSGPVGRDLNREQAEMLATTTGCEIFRRI